MQPWWSIDFGGGRVLRTGHQFVAFGISVTVPLRFLYLLLATALYILRAFDCIQYRSLRLPNIRQRLIMADKLRAQQQLEALQARYIGIGSADTTKHEWTSNMQRDSLSSFIGHPPILQYMSIGLGQPREKTRVQLLERMIQPVGPPPKVRDRSCPCG